LLGARTLRHSTTPRNKRSKARHPPTPTRLTLRLHTQPSPYCSIHLHFLASWVSQPALARLYFLAFSPLPHKGRHWNAGFRSRHYYSSHDLTPTPLFSASLLAARRHATIITDVCTAPVFFLPACLPTQFLPPRQRATMPARAATLDEALNKKGGLTLSQLANYDDLITDALVDRVSPSAVLTLPCATQN
jgi:hypothetical protein